MLKSDHRQTLLATSVIDLDTGRLLDAAPMVTLAALARLLVGIEHEIADLDVLEDNGLFAVIEGIVGLCALRLGAKGAALVAVFERIHVARVARVRRDVGAQELRKALHKERLDGGQ